MNALRLVVRAAVTVAFITVVWAVWSYDLVREHRKKRLLGSAYEGPDAD